MAIEQPPQKGADEKFCSQCGAVIKQKAVVCPKCGCAQAQSGGLNTVTPSGKNRIIAALLAFFLGGFGAHKFYLGQTGKGILMLVFCWTAIPSIIALIEGVMLLCMSDDQFIVRFH